MPGKSWGQRLRRGPGEDAPALPPAAPLSAPFPRGRPPLSSPRRMLRGWAPLAALLLAALSLASGDPRSPDPPPVSGCGMEAPSRRAAPPHHPYGLYPQGPGAHGVLGAAAPPGSGQPRGRRPRGAGGGGEELGGEAEGQVRRERLRGRDPQVLSPPRERPLPALYFSGGREQLAARPEALPDIPREEFTLEVWVKAEGGQSNPAVIAGKLRPAGGQGREGWGPEPPKTPVGGSPAFSPVAGDTPRPHPCPHHPRREVFLLPLRRNPKTSPPLSLHPPPRPPAPSFQPGPPGSCLVSPTPPAGSWKVPRGDTLRPTPPNPPFLLPRGRGYAGGFPGLPAGLSGRGCPRSPPALAALPAGARGGRPHGGSRAARTAPAPASPPAPSPGLPAPRAPQSGSPGQRAALDGFPTGNYPFAPPS